MPNYANPTQFLRLTRALVPVTAAVTVVLLAVGLYLALVVAPADYQQGETVRIMYLHVPSAWMAMFVYLVMAVAALGTLVWRHPLADVAQKAAAPLGAGLHLLLPHHRLALGQADVGHLVGVGRAADLGARAFLDLSRHHRALAGRSRIRARRRARRRFSRSSARSIFRSSNSPSTGGTRCTSRRRCSAWAARRSPPRCSGRCSSWRSASRCCS